jgi:diguanylate cyclase (GGDEF)-like protein
VNVQQNLSGTPSLKRSAARTRSREKSWTEQLELWVTVGLCSLLLSIALLATKSVGDLGRVAELQSRSHLRIAALTRIVTLLEAAHTRRYARLVDGAGEVPTQPLDEVRQALGRQLSDLQRLVGDQPEQSARARVLQIIADKQLEEPGSWMSESLRHPPDARTVRSELRAGLVLMNATHALASAMERVEEDLLVTRSRQYERQRDRLLAALWVLIGTAFVATLGAAWQLHRDIRRFRRDERTLRHAVTHDALTGLANRRQFARQLRRAFQECAKTRASFALVLIDVDRFKQINDSFGHRIGDVVLRALAARLREGFRDVDTIARVGGEEFGVILRDLDGEGAYQVADRVRTAIAAQPINPGAALGSKPVAITVSMGVAVFSQDGRTASALVDAADRALYDAKKAGRNRTVVVSSAAAQAVTVPSAT